MQWEKVFVAAVLGLGAVVAATPAAVAKEPPKCANIQFRPVASGMTDGEQDAGVYKSRFGKLEVRATVKSGEAENYYVMVKGQQPTAATGKLPASAEQCAREKLKKVSAPGQPVDKCTGQKLATVIDSAGQKKLIMLYALQGSEWKFCRAGTV